jgi:hypothetical protein
VVDDALAGELADDQLLDPHPAVRRLHHRGLVVAEPEQLGERRHGVDRGPGAAVQAAPLGGDPQPLRLLAGALVRPGDRRGERAAAGVDREEAVHRRAGADAADAQPLLAHAGAHLGKAAQHRVEDRAGTLHRLPGPWLLERVVRLRRGAHRPKTLDGDDLGGGGPHVDAEDHPRHRAHAAVLTRPVCKTGRRHRTLRPRRSSRPPGAVA